MTTLQCVVLAVIQGVAEFLPISSSGHLLLAKKVFGLDFVPFLFDIMLHMATLLAVIIFFRKKIWALLKVLFRFVTRRPQVETDDENDILCGTDERGRKTIVAVILTTLMTGVLGYLVKKYIDIDKASTVLSLCIVAGGFVLTAVLLVTSSIVEKRVTATSTTHSEAKKIGMFPTFIGESTEGIVWYKALFVGFMQGIGTLPGISRSGATISGSLFCGVEREVAGVYSFLVSIPAVLGAFILDIRDFERLTERVEPHFIVIGMIVAFVTGYASLMLLMRVIKKGKLSLFAPYLVIMAVISVIFLR